MTQPTRWAHGCFCFFVGAKNRNKTRSMGMGIIHPKKKKKGKRIMKRYFMSECIATHVSFLPLIRAIACLLRVYYAFDHILINSLLYVSSFINNILIIFIFNNYKTLSHSYQKRKKKNSVSLSFVIGPNNNRWEPLFVYFCVYVCVRVFCLWRT